MSLHRRPWSSIEPCHVLRMTGGVVLLGIAFELVQPDGAEGEAGGSPRPLLCGGDMMLEEAVVGRHPGAGTHGLEYPLPLALAAVLTAVGWWLARRHPRGGAA